MKLNQKRIILTGGTSGIGFELVNHLYSANNLIVIARNAGKLDRLAQKFKGVITYQADLSKIEDVEAVAEIITQKYDKIDGIIHNAAAQYTPAFSDNDFRYNTIKQEIDLNFTSVCCLTYLFLPLLKHKSPAFILNIGSGLGLVPKANSAIYCATKGAINIFSQSLRHQLKDTNINVLQALLPLVDTPMTKGRGKGKISATNAAKKIIYGIENEIENHDIGKVKALRLLLRLCPTLAAHIMKRG